MSFRYAENIPLREGNEMHPMYELFYLIDGKVTFISEKFYEEAGAGTLFIIPKYVYHQFKLQGEGKCKWVTINIYDYDDERIHLTKSIREIGIINDKKSPHVKAVEKMYHVLKNENETYEVKVWLYATMMMLLAEISKNSEYDSASDYTKKHSQLMLDCIDFIEDNFSKEISIDDIAREMHVSRSTLFHSFKKELGVPVYGYLLQKRLIHAYRLISEGGRPSDIYAQCGFNDYSTFYRAYRKMFGLSPSGDHKRIKNHTDTY